LVLVRMTKSHADWANEEFGGAQLGDSRRRQRLIAMAARAARRPAGTVAGVFASAAQREGAYRLLENEEVSQAALAESAYRAAAKRCGEYQFVVAPIDGSSLNLTDPAALRGLGPVGSRASGAQSVIVMTTLALSPEETPLGLLDQHYWTRSATPPKRATRRRGSKHDKRNPAAGAAVRDALRTVTPSMTVTFLPSGDYAVEGQATAGAPYVAPPTGCR
jgi:hypothetical protein